MFVLLAVDLQLSGIHLELSSVTGDVKNLLLELPDFLVSIKTEDSLWKLFNF